MSYYDIGNLSLFVREAGSGGRPVLLLHELGGSSESWSQFVPLLSGDRQVVAVDLRCAGRSEKPPGPFTLTDAADDLAVLVRALQPGGPVDVIGSALGSLVGALLAIRHPAQVRRLMMCAAAPEMAGATRSYLVERAETVRSAGMRAVAEASLANSFPAAHREARRAYRGIYLGNAPAAYAELSLALARLEIPPSDWQKIEQPVLVASGADDFLWPPEIGAKVAAMIPGAQFETLRDCGHFPHLQAPEALARLARSFLDA